jgi:hypothetical protein
LASCYDDTIRPPPLTYKHVAAYLARVAATGQPVPDELLAIHAAGSGRDGGQANTPGTSAASLAAAREARPDTGVSEASVKSQVPSGLKLVSRTCTSSATALTASQQQQQLAGPECWDALFDGLEPSAALSISDSTLSFGSCSRLSPCEPQVFTVYNNTGARLLVSVLCPEWFDPLGPPGQGVKVFQVCCRIMHDCCMLCIR